MKILVLGGTHFVGRAIAREALDRDHAVTLFHRGMTNADLFPEADRILGDRDGGLDALRGRTWDCVCDTCGYLPRVVRASVRALAESVGHYVYISSISAYADLSRPGLDESAPRHASPDPSVEEITPQTYGPLKAACEREVESFPGRTLLVRPGLIVGPHDPTDRFTYWPVRVARGGDVAAPGAPSRPVQFVDARDLARWIVARVEARDEGACHVTGPARPLTFGELLDRCRAVTGSDARFHWIPDDVLTAHEVTPFREMPLWFPAGRGSDGVLAVDFRKAVGAGLAFRPLEETLRDTLAWHESRPPDTKLGAGPDPAREAALLAAAQRFVPATPLSGRP